MSWELVKKKVHGNNLAIPDDREVGSRVSWRLVGAARHPPDPTRIANFLRRGQRLILEVRMTGLDHARDAVDLITATVNAALGVVEYSVFVEDLVNRSMARQPLCVRALAAGTPFMPAK